MMLKVTGDEIKGLILDMDGVLWRGTELLCEPDALFDLFSENGLRYMFVTNNGLRTVDEYVKKFEKLNVIIEPWQVISSAIATAELVKSDFPGAGPIHIMGSDALKSTLKQYGFFHSSQDPQAVVAGLTTDFSYDMIKDASLSIQKGIPFYYTNPDPTYPSPEGNIPGAGTILAALETASGVKAKLAGKPLPFSFQVAMQRLETKPENTLVVGDRLTTDIKGGQNAGCKTALVLSGVSTREDYNQWVPKPDLLIDTINDLIN